MHYYPQLPSTNAQAWDSDPETLPHGTVILTDHQTAGRGRRDNTWIATPGKSLTFSIILKPEAPVIQLPLFSLVASVSIAQALVEMGLMPQLKWPNDILLQMQKAGGILCESKTANRRISTLVMGLGLNVNETQEDFPPEIRGATTSLYLNTGQTFQRERVLSLILEILENNLKAGGGSHALDILNSWWQFCAHRNREVTFQERGLEVRGIFRGLTDRGEAILECHGVRETHLPDFVEVGSDKHD